MAIKKIIKIWEDGKISKESIDFLHTKTKAVTFPASSFIQTIIQDLIDNFVSTHGSGAVAFRSMGRTKYLSALQFVDGVVGNSSSGLTEAPTFRIGTVNIGDRQNGRLKADSVIDCKPEREAIVNAIHELVSEPFLKKLKKCPSFI